LAICELNPTPSTVVVVVHGKTPPNETKKKNRTSLSFICFLPHTALLDRFFLLTSHFWICWRLFVYASLLHVLFSVPNNNAAQMINQNVVQHVSVLAPRCTVLYQTISEDATLSKVVPTPDETCALCFSLSLALSLSLSLSRSLSLYDSNWLEATCKPAKREESAKEREDRLRQEQKSRRYGGRHFI